ncbi:MAG: RecQ family ATP-dependent DNA helicase [Paludibacteraceae bacterium]|nr:RecQ family ATP-dependent DNA helicase [Paludibacteraceae bacterium]
MPLLNRIYERVENNVRSYLQSYNPEHYAFIDIEVGVNDHKIHDIGAVRYDGAIYHSASRDGLLQFLEGVDYICGHNIIHHDIRYLFGDKKCRWKLVDTLPMSPLLFPERPYHHLLKDDKLISDQLNNPVNDCEKARDLLMSEKERWQNLNKNKREIYSSLLYSNVEFEGFLSFVGYQHSIEKDNLINTIRETYQGKICENVALDELIANNPCELSYALALVDTTDHRSITPGWVLHNYPSVEFVMHELREKRCAQGCIYCHSQLNLHKNLKTYFGYDEFRTYEGEPLQERAAQAAVNGESLLAIFPTGGGKSLTFQLPALMAGRSVHGLTVVISPLQSLMKDQVDNLEQRGLPDAVTINGLLDPITRANAIQRIMDGDASLLYIAPEMLRSKTIERILLNRHIVRFVIDEAHCFSSWGHDFRVDYLYIGKFIREYQKKKNCKTPIPISCFTATAKQKVIQDICDYFHFTLGLNLNLFASAASRTNLQYSVIHSDTDEEKYFKLRGLIASNDCPTIIYVSRTKRTQELAHRLQKDGFQALPFHGKMSAEDKVANQEKFMSDQVRIIVATSAFGMGVDKKNVGLVVHYDISDSLENYVQEAGRAGRDPQLQAKCFVLYNDNDLDKHFIFLNQNKLSISEIQQVWKAVKDLTKQRLRVSCSALEIARQAGWDDSVNDLETRVKTALHTLEQGGYLERGNNIPHVYATGITVQNVEEARKKISNSILFGPNEVENAVRIIKSLISNKYIAKAQDSEAESRIDYLADRLGLHKKEVVSAIERMRQEGILADTKDLSAFLLDSDSERKSYIQLDKFVKLERYIINQVTNDVVRLSLKQLNDDAISNGLSFSTEKDIRTLLFFLSTNGYIRKIEDIGHNMELVRVSEKDILINRFDKRIDVCKFTLEWLYRLAEKNKDEQPNKIIQFSIVELLNKIKGNSNYLFGNLQDIKIEEVEEALLYLSKVGILRLEGGFLVLYNAMDIKRLQENNIRYKRSDYRMLDEFYKQKIQQIHIVGEYANLMVRNYDAALQFVQDYFQMDYKRFIAKYFKGNRMAEIEHNMTPQKYEKIFGQLSERQKDIVMDKDSRCIVVAAGPGSGKTRILVHKLASLLQLEDVKHEQLLMLTFSRAAATEFKQRLIELSGNAAHFVEIKTFHSYCFDLLGRTGNLEDVKNVVTQAADMISRGEVEINKIRKTVLVIDEAQDMGEDDYRLVKALMDNNEDMRVIAVGDDDQNIFDFRGSDSKYMQLLLKEPNARFVEMTENYRSAKQIVESANKFAKLISHRLKQTPIIPVRNNEGQVTITHHRSEYLYTPLVEQLLENRGHGTTCVLTQKNEEAITLLALMRKKGIQCKLIQSMDENFRFANIVEMRYFMKIVDAGTKTSYIDDNVWAIAKERTYCKYKDSTSYEYVKRCVELFETTNKIKYLTDFKEYVYESSLEDFCNVEGTEIVLSTIHKAKGHEFDNVYMLISGVTDRNDNEFRKYYVGLTRAKNRLFIHTNCTLFDDIKCATHIYDQAIYSEPNEVMLQLSHKDVVLDFFKSRKKKEEILTILGGSPLTFEDNYLKNPNTNTFIAKLSQHMREVLQQEWIEKGYVIQSANSRFVVAWKPKDTSKLEEYAVLLADLLLIKQ